MKHKRKETAISIVLRFACVILILAVGFSCVSAYQGAVREWQEAAEHTPTTSASRTEMPVSTVASAAKTGDYVTTEESALFVTSLTDTATSATAVSTASTTAKSTKPTTVASGIQTRTTSATEKSRPNATVSDGSWVLPMTPEQCPDDTAVLAHYQDDGLEFVINRVSREKLVYYAVELRLSDPYQLLTAFANNSIDRRSYTSRIAEKNGALLAINGDFCGYDAKSIVIRNGVAYRDVPRARDLLLYGADGSFTYRRDKETNTQQLLSEGVFHAFSFGPVLVKDGEATDKQVLVEHFLSSRAREPRTAIGCFEPLHYLILVVDGRQDRSQGMRFDELQDTFVSYGVDSAYNLDGGGSSTLYYDGQVLNSPCVKGERSVSDIIFVKKTA